MKNAQLKLKLSSVDWLVLVSSLAFIFILVLSALYDNSIRILHTFQAVIYVIVIILSFRQSAWGYGAGCFIAVFWNWTNLIHTTFIASGLHEFTTAIQTGQVSNPDKLIAVIAAAAHFVLICSCLAGYFRIRDKGLGKLIKFIGGGLLAVSYFVIIIFLFGPQYIPLLKQFFQI